MKLSRSYTDVQWKAAFKTRHDWDRAIDIVEDRIRSRWLDPVEQILDDWSSGFAVLALDCIILESLWGFMHGRPVQSGEERQVYRDILRGAHFGWTDSQSDDFRKFVRNGLMHDAETRSRWLVKKTVPRNAILEARDGGYVLNRTKFHRALVSVFEDWVGRMRAQNQGLRTKMRARMNQIIAKHFE